MTTNISEKPALAAGAKGVFSRVLVGIDGSKESLEAACQAARMVEDDGQLTLLSAWNVPTPPVAVTGFSGLYQLDLEGLRRDAVETLGVARKAIQAFPPPISKIARGIAWDALLAEIDHDRDTLVAVGSHGQGRVEGILAGSTTTELVHKAQCSVLVARKSGDRFPRKIVVGVDGSPHSAAAYKAANRLAVRFGAELWPVVAYGGEEIDKRLVSMIVDHHHEELQGEPVSALLAAASDADLLVVGSRGLHGLKALGSVSERVAHEAHCSVLIVREPPWQRVQEELAD
jgi:nucleotide-binding universal stress UspA family protein